MPKKKYFVKLTEEQCQELQHLIRRGTTSARVITRARILLKASDGCTDEEIATALGVGIATTERVRKRFELRGLQGIYDLPRPGQKPKLDVKAEARLIAEACSQAPEGRKSWTLQLLADRVVELNLADSYSYEAVRRVLKKTKLNLGSSDSGASRR